MFGSSSAQVSPVRESRVRCSLPGVDTSFMTGLLFPFLLIISATLYAFKTRKCPGGFNETRFILFTNCINTIHWLAFVPLYMVSTDHKIRAVILAYSLSLSGIVQLGCLIFPKLYTVLFKVTNVSYERILYTKLIHHTFKWEQLNDPYKMFSIRCCTSAKILKFSGPMITFLYYLQGISKSFHLFPRFPIQI